MNPACKKDNNKLMMLYEGVWEQLHSSEEKRKGPPVNKKPEPVVDVVEFNDLPKDVQRAAWAQGEQLVHGEWARNKFKGNSPNARHAEVLTITIDQVRADLKENNNYSGWVDGNTQKVAMMTLYRYMTINHVQSIRIPQGDLRRAMHWKSLQRMS
jgi:hypothetical protein